MRHENVCWAWPLATRSAFHLGDTAAVEELIAVLESHPVGHLPPILRAERTLARARLRATNGEAVADTDLGDAITQLRAVASPYHLAHALLDRAEHRIAIGELTGVDPLIDEARTIAERLRARPLIDRVSATRNAMSGARTSLADSSP
jgi:hypothetical protein